MDLLEIPMITLNFSRLFKKEMSEVLLISSVSPLWLTREFANNIGFSKPLLL